MTVIPASQTSFQRPARPSERRRAIFVQSSTKPIAELVIDALAVNFDQRRLHPRVVMAHDFHEAAVARGA